MAHPTPLPKLDRYVVIHVATTCDEHGVYVAKDSAEVIEVAWILLDTNTLEELHRESALVKPSNSPITPLCTSTTTLTWEHVRSAGTFKDAVNRLDSFVQEHLTSKNFEFAFVTLDAWNMRVQLPREARDKGLALPPYLQHSRSFDLRTEYQRWQQRHPESIPFAPTDLANICTALDVDPVQSSAPIKHNLPFHLHALAPQSPRRAMEEAVTLSRVLHGLIRKSQPAHEHPDILTRPMDALADVRAFIAERSKVLYMSGLPHDTTQSELESWYTQYGGRPVAFVTFQTPDQHKPTGKGFAIFSSHEEATESLCMNGRALNDKAIEVCPSSSRVLDRSAAAGILAPFPPSKNRPRPGDWTCPSCGFSNFQRRTACYRCSFPGHHQAAALAAAAAPHPLSYAAYGYPPVPPPQPHGLANHHAHHAPHHHHHHHHPPSHHGGSGDGGRHSSRSSGHGGGGGGGGSSGGVVPFRAGDWKCGRDGCGYHNFAKNIACLRCQAPRANAAVVPDSSPAAMAAAAAMSMGVGIPLPPPPPVAVPPPAPAPAPAPVPLPQISTALADHHPGHPHTTSTASHYQHSHPHHHPHPHPPAQPHAYSPAPAPAPAPAFQPFAFGSLLAALPSIPPPSHHYHPIPPATTTPLPTAVPAAPTSPKTGAVGSRVSRISSPTTSQPATTAVTVVQQPSVSVTSPTTATAAPAASAAPAVTAVTAVTAPSSLSASKAATVAAGVKLESASSPASLREFGGPVSPFAAAPVIPSNQAPPGFASSFLS